MDALTPACTRCGGRGWLDVEGVPVCLRCVRKVVGSIEARANLLVQVVEVERAAEGGGRFFPPAPGRVEP